MQSIRKVIFISYLPLTPKIRKDYFMDRLLDEGFDLAFWDISALIHYTQDGKQTTDFSHTIGSYKALSVCIKQEDKEHTLFISLANYDHFTWRVQRLLTRYRCKTGRFGFNMVPLVEGVRKPLWRKLLSLRPSKLKLYVRSIEALWAKWAKKRGLVAPFDVVFCSGKKGHLCLGLAWQVDLVHALVKQINATDYTYSQQLKEHDDQPVPGDFIVFLDEYLPLHPDIALLNLPVIDAEYYYGHLNRFFSQIEERYGVPVVIAAHPKAERYRSADFFEGRSVLFGRTAELVRDCQWVLGHDSTSLAFGVLFNKPMVLLTTQMIDETMPCYGNSFRSFSEELGAPLVFFDQKLPDSLTLACDRPKYDRYRYEYLTSPESEDQSSADIVVATIRNYY